MSSIDPNDQADPVEPDNDELRSADTDASEEGLDGELSLAELAQAYAKAAGIEPPPVEPSEETPPRAFSTGRTRLSRFTSFDFRSDLVRRNAGCGRETHFAKNCFVDARCQPERITQLAKELNLQYEEEGAPYRIERDKMAMRLALHEEYEPIRARFYGEVRMAKLSQLSIDVLAIIAYHQPITRVQIDKIRGKDCRSVLNQLVKRGLLAVEDDPQTPRTVHYRTTDRFLELFGLETLEDLPQSEDAVLPDTFE